MILGGVWLSPCASHLSPIEETAVARTARGLMRQCPPRPLRIRNRNHGRTGPRVAAAFTESRVSNLTGKTPTPRHANRSDNATMLMVAVHPHRRGPQPRQRTVLPGVLDPARSRRLPRSLPAATAREHNASNPVDTCRSSCGAFATGIDPEPDRGQSLDHPH